MDTKAYRCLLGHIDAVHTLTKSEAGCLIMCGLTEQSHKSDRLIDVAERSMGYKVIDSRYSMVRDALKIEAAISPSLLIFLGMISNSPGTSVMWAYSCLLKAQESDTNYYGIDAWAYDFPFGIPTDDEMQRIWEQQKEGGNNWLDRNEWAI